MVVYDAECVGIAISKYLASKTDMKPSQVVPLTLSSADEVTTIKCEVFDELKIKWKGTEVELPAVVKPGVGFDELLEL